MRLHTVAWPFVLTSIKVGLVARASFTSFFQVRKISRKNTISGLMRGDLFFSSCALRLTRMGMIVSQVCFLDILLRSFPLAAANCA